MAWQKDDNYSISGGNPYSSLTFIVQTINFSSVYVRYTVTLLAVIFKAVHKDIGQVQGYFHVHFFIQSDTNGIHVTSCCHSEIEMFMPVFQILVIFW